jgi:NAD(P)-dependent dehydrogenase (short-subunit alcohol dehydrogenase family)
MGTERQCTPPSVVITGTSTGIGEVCALAIERMGYQVFAGVRREEDGVALARKASGRLTWLLLDVTDTRSIEMAVRTVTTLVGEKGLFGLVNNAGVSSIGPLEFLPIVDLRKLLEVNVIGQLAVTQAFMPLLRRARGRIINIGSISGRLALPFGGAYSVSKFAVEALTDELRLELYPWGLHVAIIEPGGIATPLWEKSIVMAERLPEQAQDYYGPFFPMLRTLAARWGKQGTAPEEVAQVVIHALTARRPKTRYFVGCRAGLSARLLSHLPDRARDRLIASQLARYVDLSDQQLCRKTPFTLPRRAVVARDER